MTKPIAALVLCLALIGGPDARAETIVLTSGAIVSGKILKEEKDSILVDAGIETPVTYFRDEIKSIVPDAKPGKTDPSRETQSRADELERKALELIDAGRMDEGLTMMQEAVALDPSAFRRMNYGSILFGNGVELFKAKDTDEALEVLRACEGELNAAIAAFDPVRDAAFLAQSHFLLGEIYANAFQDPQTAQVHYTKSKEFRDSRPAAN